MVNRFINKNIKKKVRIRDNNQCVKCGNKNTLIFHHIIFISQGGSNKYENIQLLCRECHDKIHYGFEYINKETLLEYEYEEELWNSAMEFQLDNRKMDENEELLFEGY